MGSGVIYFAAYSPVEKLVHFIVMFMVILFVILLSWMVSSNNDSIANAASQNVAK